MVSDWVPLVAITLPWYYYSCKPTLSDYAYY